MRIFTYTLNGANSMTISSTDGVNQISIQAKASGSCTVLGNIGFKGLTPNAVTLSDGQSLTLTSTPNTPLDGIVITAVAGDTDIIIGM